MAPENKRIPEWAQRERQADLAWIAENLDVFWTAATTAFDEAGRGAIVVDTTVQPIPDVGHPFGYFSQEQVEQQANEDTTRMVTEYDPEHEFVVVLLKRDDRISTYRVRALETEQLDWDFWYLQDREAALAAATEAEMQLLLAGAEQLEAEGAPNVAQQLRGDAERIRQRLTGLLWPEFPERSARVNLRGALANLRRVIGDRQTTPPFLHVSREALQGRQSRL